MSQISLRTLQAAKEQLSEKYKKHTLVVGSASFDVVIASFNPTEKIGKITEFLFTNAQLFEALGSEEVVTAFVALKAFTDIDFGEDIESEIETFATLLNYGVMEKVFELINQEQLMEFAASLKQAIDLIAEQINKEAENGTEQEGGTIS